MLHVLAWPSGSPQELNPYVRLMYAAFMPPAAKIIAFRPLMRQVPAADVFHIHWPEGIFEGRGGGIAPVAALKAYRVLRVARQIRRAGGLVALTAHNATPHLSLAGWRRTLWERYHPWLLRETGLLIGLSQGSLATFREKNPAAAAIPGCVIPHPHYRTVYPPAPAPRVARETLGLPIDRSVIGMIGSMRASKHVGAAIRVFREAASESEMLLVMGACDDAIWSELSQAAGGDPSIRLQRGALRDQELSTAFGAIDVCLLNQATILNSGTALLALSFGVPVIAPASGALPELRAFCGGDWVSLFAPPLTASALRGLLDGLPKAARQPCAALEKLSPDRLSNELLERFTSWRRAPSD